MKLKAIRAPILSWLTIALLASARAASSRDASLAFTVSMENPAAHTFHVEFKCDGLKGGVQDFKLPVWTPGYYALLNGAQFVSNFTAADGLGHQLKWDKTTTNTWQVQTGAAETVVVRYDVLATRPFVATCYLDENHAYIMAASLCMYVGGMVQHPVRLTLIPDVRWTNIATGLDPVSPKTPFTLAAKDFDILYDSPILIGNLDQFPSFDVRGVHHYFTGYDTGITNREEWIANLQKVVAAGVDVIGEVPYHHYTFIAMGPGRGGIEHLNSTSFGFDGRRVGTKEGMAGQLDFLAHEYFHTFNVERIRPVVLGPFDYDHPVRTRMLWVSEGFTSYYEEILLRRAGITTQEQILDSFHKHIAACETNTGHLFQSATEARLCFVGPGPGHRPAHRQPGHLQDHFLYEKGPVLGLLLDFTIRHDTGNTKSLDTVMRTLYRKYFKEEKRGWTDDEFQQVCEDTAGVPLQEIFDYASTTKDVDYDKYLGYAGLKLEPAVELTNAGPWWRGRGPRRTIVCRRDGVSFPGAGGRFAGRR